MVDIQSVGEQQSENILDDFQSIDLEIDTLIAKFITPIDSYRSRNAPNVFTNNIFSDIIGTDVGLGTPNSLQESRAHAFYRLLGLPVINSDGKFFNPGFNPLRNDAFNNEADISNSLSILVKYAIATRENDARLRVNRFSRANIEASTYSLALATPKGQRKFMIMDESLDSLSEFDLQSVKIPERKSFITTRYKKRDGSEITNTYDTVTHILRPFMTDPVISSQLDPKSGSRSVMIAVPFLNKEDTEYERNKYVKRPGIEFILRLRLRQQNILESSSNMFDQITLKSLEGEVSANNQKEIAAVLSNTGVDDSDINRILNNVSAIELYTLNDLVKTFKGLIDLYVKNIEIIERVYKQIIWSPLSNEGGPEKGTDVSTGFIIPKSFLDSWEIERRIVKLEAKSLFAKNQTDIGDDLSYSDFTISEFQNMVKLFDDRLQDAKNERSKLETEASNALRIIEYISGEVSGLGLIDIIAIYMAMWSVDINVLLDLIDDAAAKRLFNIDELKTQAVINRASKIGNAKDSYKIFEKRIMSILSYGDKLYNRSLGSPNEEEGGDIPRDNVF